MGTLWRDIRYGGRMLRNKPGFTVVVVLTLGLGIGANTAIFSFLDRIFLRTLAVERPHELVKVKYLSDHGSVYDDFNYPLYASYRDQSEAFSGLAAYALCHGGVDLSVEESTEQVMGMAVSDNYFSVLGVRPVLGRAFVSQDNHRPSADPVVVISHGLWQRKFGGDRTVLGQTIRVNNHALTIIGVAPPEFTGTFVGVGPAAYMPLHTWASMSDIAIENRAHSQWNLLGRLKPGVSRDQAQANLRVLAEQIRQVEPLNTNPRILISDGSRGNNLWTEEALWLPFALIQFVTALVLVVACANVANMLLARGTTRQKEIAIRRAMGASRRDVIRQLLVESSLLALLAGACGVLLAHGLCAALRSTVPLVRMSDMPLGVDARILVFALLGSLGSVLFFGLAPALQVSRPNVMATLKDGSGVITVLARRRSLRSLLVVTQVAVSVVVLAFGMLCIRSVRELHVADPGYDSARILGVSVDLGRESSTTVDVGQLFVNLKERVASFPGVQAVSLATGMPLSARGDKTNAIRIDNFQMPAAPDYISWRFFIIGPGYFQTLDVPLVRGRNFSRQDGPGAPEVMIVNELMAQRYWPGQDPIGKRVSLGMGGTREVIGVVKTVKLRSIRAEPVPLSFWPLTQPMNIRGKPYPPDSKQVLLVRAESDPQALVPLIQKTLESMGLDPGTYEVRTLAERASDSITAQHMIARILNVIGFVGLLFVATGIAGVMAYEVSQRTREIGIRMALGAQQRNVLELVLRKGAVLTLVGLGLGIGLSAVPLWILGRLLPEIRMWDAFLLYGVHMWDPLTFAGVALLVGLAALVACWLPARRAAKIDPMVALRYE